MEEEAQEILRARKAIEGKHPLIGKDSTLPEVRQWVWLKITGRGYDLKEAIRQANYLTNHSKQAIYEDIQRKWPDFVAAITQEKIHRLPRWFTPAP